MRRLAALSALLAACLVAGCETRAGFPMSTQAPDVALAGAGGTHVSLARGDGRVSMVTFGYTSCPDVCPTTLGDWRRLRRELGDDAGRVRFVFVSVDWKNDTPATAEEFAHRFDSTFVGVAADSVQLLAVLPPFKAEARYEGAKPGFAGSVSHTDYTYLVDPQGRILTAFPFATKPAAVARQLRVAIRAAAAATR